MAPRMRAFLQVLGVNAFVAEDQALLAELVQKVDQLGPIYFEFDAFTAVTVIANVQLALRHPGNLDRHHMARTFAHRLINRLGELAADQRIVELLNRGFDPRHDRTITDAERTTP